MRIITCFTIIMFILLPFSAFNGNTPPSSTTLFDRKMDILFHAIAYVESRNNPNCINKREQAFGIIQIRKIYVDEVNRLYNLHLNHKDAFSVKWSYDVFILTMKAYNKDGDFERGARTHNGGSNGWYVTETNDYWIKVEEQLKKNKSIIK